MDRFDTGRPVAVGAARGGLVTTTTEQVLDRYARQFARFETAPPRGRDGWLTPLRKAAFAHFAELGFPTTREEAWRFTNVAPLAGTEFVGPERDEASVSSRDVRRFCLGTDAEVLLVFVNGSFAPTLSRMTNLPAGVRVASLAAVLADSPAALREHLGRHAAYQTDAFTALNTAFFEDGAFVWIPRGMVVNAPLHLLYVSVSETQPTLMHPRNLIVADENSQFQIVEQYVALGDGIYFNNAVTELVAGENVVAQHCKVVRESDAAYHVGTVQLHQGRASRVVSHGVLLGGALVRHNINPVLDGEGANSELHGLYLLTGTQHADNHLRVEHRRPRTSSHEYFRGILDGRSHGVFSGRIVVYPEAQKTDAKQTNMNLLLSEGAQVHSHPQLEIRADDVKCTHGSTTGQVDDDAMFYLRSRGVPADAARSLLIYAFARESLDRVPIEPLRRPLTELVLARLPHGELLRETA